MSIEQALDSAGTSNYDSSKYDKVYGRQDAEFLRNIMKRPLQKDDFPQINHALASPEHKTLNYKEYDRFHINKFLTWISDVILVSQLVYEDQYELYKRMNTCRNCHKSIDSECKCSKNHEDYEYNKKIDYYNHIISLLNYDFGCNYNYKEKITVQEPMLKVSDTGKRLMENTRRYLEHNVKVLVHIYMSIARTSLSVEATGFMEGMRNTQQTFHETKDTSKSLEEAK